MKPTIKGLQEQLRLQGISIAFLRQENEVLRAERKLLLDEHQFLYDQSRALAESTSAVAQVVTDLKEYSRRKGAI